MAQLKLSAEQLVKIYRGRQAVKGVSLEVEQGSIVGLLGPNGAGKTTTFYMIAGVVRPDRGVIYLDEAEITHYPMHKRARCVHVLPHPVREDLLGLFSFWCHLYFFSMA